MCLMWWIISFLLYICIYTTISLCVGILESWSDGCNGQKVLHAIFAFHSWHKVPLMNRYKEKEGHNRGVCVCVFVGVYFLLGWKGMVLIGWGWRRGNQSTMTAASVSSTHANCNHYASLPVHAAEGILEGQNGPYMAYRVDLVIFSMLGSGPCSGWVQGSRCIWRGKFGGWWSSG